ncbi:hypothetical protein [Reyranella sp.]|uniref:hypothetical protein n=1 Tax=Reyranella sp. TaxID=1929291 RepID=UPI00122BEBB2|nr:hypothetical protein [Reyranella sp.]TAJ88657.1 MAG: hypothetical protein EPO50_07775 [Reyranella sp.]
MDKKTVQIRGLLRSAESRAIAGQVDTPELGKKMSEPCNLDFGMPLPAVRQLQEHPMNSIIYLVGLVVIVMAILSFVGFR